MPSTNTITVQKPGTTREKDERYAFAFLGQRQVQGGLGSTGSHLHTVEAGKQDEFVRSIYPKWDIRYADRDAGFYHPNVHMGSYDRGSPVPPRTPDQQRAMVTAIEREEILIEDLRSIARVVTPRPETKDVFGSRIRNLLIMACTEVEAQWKAILRANGYPGDGTRWNVNDYAKIALPLRLGAYKSSCDRFPDYPHFSPFDSWQPGSRLPWYKAYNDTKHDADGKATSATLEHAISAVGAVCTLILAQYGPPYLDESGGVPFFGLIDTPTWEAHERSYPPPTNQLWVPVPYDFTKP